MSTVVQQTGASDKTDVHPFHVEVPEAELTELRRRISATRWPERETVTDESQGVPRHMVPVLRTPFIWSFRRYPGSGFQHGPPLPAGVPSALQVPG